MDEKSHRLPPRWYPQLDIDRSEEANMDHLPGIYHILKNRGNKTRLYKRILHIRSNGKLTRMMNGVVDTYVVIHQESDGLGVRIDVSHPEFYKLTEIITRTGPPGIDPILNAITQNLLKKGHDIQHSLHYAVNLEAEKQWISINHGDFWHCIEFTDDKLLLITIHLSSKQHKKYYSTSHRLDLSCPDSLSILYKLLRRKAKRR